MCGWDRCTDGAVASGEATRVPLKQTRVEDAGVSRDASKGAKCYTSARSDTERDSTETGAF